MIPAWWFLVQMLSYLALIAVLGYYTSKERSELRAERQDLYSRIQARDLTDYAANREGRPELASSGSPYMRRIDEAYRQQAGRAFGDGG